MAQDDTDVLLFEVLTLDGPEFSALLVDAPPQTDGNGSVTSTISGGGQPLRAGRYRVEISALGEIPGEREFTIR